MPLALLQLALQATQSSPPDPPYWTLPESIRTLVYFIGMVGFPVVVASWLLMNLSGRLKSVDRNLAMLSDRIQERPMSLERTTDLIIYSCRALQFELQCGFHLLVRRDLDFRCLSPSSDEVARTLSIIRREVNGFLRPLFREHQRFLSRYPTVGGNLATLFTLSAPAEDIQQGETEARLAGETFKDPAEAAAAVIMNNIPNFGDHRLERLAKKPSASSLPPALKAALGLPDDSSSDPEETPIPEEADGPFEVISPDLFLKLGLDGIETICVVLRDTMLEKLRLNSSELEPPRSPIQA